MVRTTPIRPSSSNVRISLYFWELLIPSLRDETTAEEIFPSHAAAWRNNDFGVSAALAANEESINNRAIRRSISRSPDSFYPKQSLLILQRSRHRRLTTPGGMCGKNLKKTVRAPFSLSQFS